MSTLLKKDYYGRWTVTTVEMITDTLELRVTTCKLASDGDLKTIASVGSNNGLSTTSVSGLDFYELLERSNPKRCTSAVVLDQHVKVDLARIKERVLDFYNITSLV
jgi:hypothetical protein